MKWTGIGRNRWTEAEDYMRYYTDWPKGRHMADAKLRYEQRTWSDTKMGHDQRGA